MLHRLALSRAVLAASLAASFAIAAPARAQTATPAPQGVLNLSATATVEVPRDLLAVTLSTTREGRDAAAVQGALKQALDAALAEARKAARPRALEVRTGNFSLYPRYAEKGGIVGWQGSAELIVEGSDFGAISALAGRIEGLTVARVGYGLSREARERVEAEVTAQAVERFRSKAAESARLFGFQGYTLREVSVATDVPGPTPPVPMMQARAKFAGDEALPMEAGKGSVSANVSGSVQLR